MIMENTFTPHLEVALGGKNKIEVVKAYPPVESIRLAVDTYRYADEYGVVRSISSRELTTGLSPNEFTQYMQKRGVKVSEEDIEFLADKS
jgi:hypothetical protein